MLIFLAQSFAETGIQMKNICTLPSIQYCTLHILVDALETERTEKIMPPRNRILLEQGQRIIQAFEDVSEDYLMVAATIRVNRSTAGSIVARYLREGSIAERPRGGANHVRVDDEMRNCLNDIINENCLLTLAQIYQELRQRLARKSAIHDRTVARTLEGMLYRVKLVRPLPADQKPLMSCKKESTMPTGSCAML